MPISTCHHLLLQAQMMRSHQISSAKSRRTTLIIGSQIEATVQGNDQDLVIGATVVQKQRAMYRRTKITREIPSANLIFTL